MDNEIRILLADDHPIVRKGLRASIEEDAGLKVVAETGDGETALALIRKLRPDVAVLDIDMPKLDGIGVARELASQRLDVKIIFLTLHEDKNLFRLAISLGAKGYILKDSVMGEIATGVRSVSEGRPYYSSAMMTGLINASDQPLQTRNPITMNLTPAECRILRMIADGKSSKEIGSELSLHYRTVENHRSNICRKLKIDGASSLLRFALQNRNIL